MAGEPITVEALSAIQGDDFRSLVPGDYKEKPYMKTINSFTDLFKNFDGAQALIGRNTLPTKDSTPEQWTEFHQKLRPETPEGYEIPSEIEGVPVEYLEKIKASEAKGLRQLLHSASLSPYQAKSVLTPLFQMMYAAEQAETKTKDASYETLTKELFGEEKETIKTNGLKFLHLNTPDNLKGLISGLDEKSLTVVLALANGLSKKVTGEDGFRGVGDGTGAGADTYDSLLVQMQAIQKDEAWVDPFKDRQKHKELQDKMQVIRNKMAALKK